MGWPREPRMRSNHPAAEKRKETLKREITSKRGTYAQVQDQIIIRVACTRMGSREKGASCISVKRVESRFSHFVLFNRRALSKLRLFPSFRVSTLKSRQPSCLSCRSSIIGNCIRGEDLLSFIIIYLPRAFVFTFLFYIYGKINLLN